MNIFNKNNKENKNEIANSPMMVNTIRVNLVNDSIVVNGGAKDFSFEYTGDEKLIKTITNGEYQFNLEQPNNNGSINVNGINISGGRNVSINNGVVTVDGVLIKGKAQQKVKRAGSLILNLPIDIQRVVAKTVNGDIAVNWDFYETFIESVNGAVTIDSSGITQVKNVNGSINILSGAGAAETVNGSINIDYRVFNNYTLRTVNGTVRKI